ncbi:putative beta-lysine N-acetyltransferase [Clostridium beijerinckii]|uniref:N-acetyltransferase YodP n=1 Tax=Clostridium beijerinckii TaxID=1520 RepID=A0A1S8S8G3_CLOBE|nr:putative beta-lysine N-acetyltransferase [Clostridium beijerinckii]NRY62422.1 putative beta-lysine N-acetyltransferase [Clostridium beijerinckii]OOM61612.1 N-acetyltransferase YodP [Clostridium beijerinckii]
MRASRCELNNTFYAKIDRTKILVDLPNKRIKIIDFNTISTQNLKRIIHFASKQHLSKILCNCDTKSFETFINAGFNSEGKISGYFKGNDAFCMSYFINSDRKVCSNFARKELLIKECQNVKNTYAHQKNNLGYLIRNANRNDIKEMIDLFSTVFLTYQSPIYDEEYLKQTMNDKVLYKVAVYNGKIISIASADMNKENLNAEITDCATHPSYRGIGILSNIIYSLESDLKTKGFVCLYSLSRSVNPSINFVLSKHNYNFAGRLVNNCNICGTFEDMNLWVKNINSTSI